MAKWIIDETYDDGYEYHKCSHCNTQALFDYIMEEDYLKNLIIIFQSQRAEVDISQMHYSKMDMMYYLQMWLTEDIQIKAACKIF